MSYKDSFNERWSYYSDKWVDYGWPSIIGSGMLLMFYLYPAMMLFVTGMMFLFFGVPVVCALVELYLKKPEVKDGD